MGTKLALRTRARRHEARSAEMTGLEASLDELTARANPALRGANGVGPDVAALLLTPAGENPERLTSEAAFAALCAAAPVEASSGKTVRHRLHRGGNRPATHALWRIVMVRISTGHVHTAADVECRPKEGRSRREIVRCRKRDVAREVSRHLVHREPVPAGADLRAARLGAGSSLQRIADGIESRPNRICELERALSFDTALTQRYGAWLPAQHPHQDTGAARCAA